MISFQIKMEKGKAEAKRAAVNPGYPVTKDILKILGQSIKRRMFRGRFVSVATSWRGYNTKKPKSGCCRLCLLGNHQSLTHAV